MKLTLPSLRVAFSTLPLPTGLSRVPAGWRLALFAGLLAGSLNAQADTNYTASGSFTWVCPADVTLLKVECWGGGGGGGGDSATSSGGGGSGGAYGRKNYYTVTPSTTYFIQVGAAGTAGASGNNAGGAGGTSWFSNATPAVVVSAKGGGGGLGGSSSAAGTGGTCPAGSTGDVTYLGGAGLTGLNGTTVGPTTAYGGGGGSSAGTGSVGNVGSNNGSAAAVTGGGPGGSSRSATAGNGNAPVSGPGGGGGGGCSAGASSRTGGTGWAGQVILTYNPPLVLDWVGDGVNNRWSTNTGNICWDSGTDGIADLGFADGNATTFGAAGAARPTVNLETRVAPASLAVNASSDYTFAGSGWLSGSMALIKSGAGVLTLNSTNDYSGGTTINTGRIRLANTNVLGTGLVTLSGGALSSSGATARTLTNGLKVTATSTLGDGTDTGLLTFTSLVDFNGAARTLTINSETLFAGGGTNGAVSIKQGPGTLTMKGSVNYTNLNITLDVTAGTMVFDGATVLSQGRIIPDATAGNAARLIITNGSSVTSTSSNGNLRSGRAGAATGSNYVDLAGAYSLPNAVLPDGCLTLYGGAAYSEMTLWPGADFTANGVTNGTTGGAGNTRLNFNGGILRARLSTPFFFPANVLSNATVQAGGAFIDTSNFNITIGQNLLDGGGGLTKSGTGALTLSGISTYTGSTVVSNGTLVVATTSLTGGGGLIVKDGAALTVNNNSGTLAASALTLGVSGASTVNFNFPAGNVAVASINAGTLTGNGTVTINITGSGLVAGSIPLIAFSSGSAANLQLGSLPAGVSATLDTSASPVTLNISSAIQQLVWTGAADNQWNTSSTDWTNLFSLTPAIYTQSGGIGDQVRFDDTAPGSTAINLGIVATPVSVTVNNNSLAYTIGGAGSIGGSGTLTKSGTNALTLGTVNTFSGGGTVTNGTLFVGADSALGTGSIGVGGGVMIAPLGGSFTLSNVLASVMGGNLNIGVTNGSLTLQRNVVLSNGGKLFVTGGSNLVIKSSLQLISTGAGLDIYNGSRVILDGASATNTDDGIRFHSSGGAGVTELDLTNNAVYVVGVSSGSPNVRLGQDASVTGTNVIRISSGLFLMTNTAGAIIVGDKLGTTGMVYQTGGSVISQTAAPGTGNSGIMFGSTSGAYGEYHLDGGLLSTPRVTTTAGSTGLLYLNGGTLAANTNSFAAGFLAGTTVYVSAGGATIDDGGFVININSSLQDNGGGNVTKVGSGSLLLNGTNTYTGTTVVSQGTLGGTGALSGPVTLAANTTLAPSVPGVIGTLTISNSLTLNGSGQVAMVLNKGIASTNNDAVAGLTAVAYAGTLTVTNSGASPLAGGETFQLFSATGSKTGNFSSVVILPNTGATNGTFNPATGLLTINSLIPTAPTNLTFSVSGGNLNLSWPTNYLGWSLQAQTNSLGTGLSTNWVTIPGTESVTATNFPAVLTNGAVFYRMFYLAP